MTAFMRFPQAAGTFYPKMPDELRVALDRCYLAAVDSPGAKALPEGRVAALGAVIPHAGYVYSGAVAARVYRRLKIPGAVLILSPNHTGVGPRLSIWPAGTWMTPIGNVRVHERLTDLLCEECPNLEQDTLAHRSEHGIEVHMPFLVRERPDVRIAAVVVGTQEPVRLDKLAQGIAKAIGRTGEDVLIIASSDMNHYEDQATTLAKDQLALDRLLRLDGFGLLDTCKTREVTMCGVGPTTAMLRACALRGAKEAILVDHRTSGDACGDFDRVVGYAGVIVR